MTTLKVLKRAYHLLDSKERWTVYALARDKDGRGVSVHAPEAVQWCAVGALQWAGRGGHVHDAHLKLREALSLHEDMRKGNVATVNNGPDGYERIREGFRTAIAKLEPPVERTPVETLDHELVTV